MSIDVLGELRRLNVNFEYRSDTEVRTLCPFHEDSQPSCDIRVDRAVFNCRSCPAEGHFSAYVAQVLGVERQAVLLEFAKKYGEKTDRTVEPAVVEKCHGRIWQAGPLLKALYDRGLDDEDIRRYRLGERRGRITIPIKNRLGQFVNLRQYSPGAPGPEKMRNMRGRGDTRLFPADQLNYKRIVLTGGEIKAIACARRTNSSDIGAVTATCGESNWDHAFNADFVDKEVYICYDIDRAGSDAAKLRAAMLYPHAESVSIITLPLDIDRFPHGDINDYIAEGGNVLELLETAEEWEPSHESSSSDEEPTDIDLRDVTQPNFVNRRIRFKSLVSAIGESPYLVPKTLTVKCDRSQNNCSICPIIHREQDPLIDLEKESDALIEMIGSTKLQQRDAIRRGLKIPVCKSVEFEDKEYYRLDEVLLGDDLSVSNVDTTKTNLHAVFVDGDMDLNETREITGRVVPHPKTQRATVVTSTSKCVDDSLSSFTLERPEALETFQPTSWNLAAVEEKLDEIYEDFENNVTRIFQRRDMHVMMDLAFHSCLLMKVGGRSIKGWSEVLIVGDSSQGKSEAAGNLMRHYGLGDRVDCKNATTAGLLGGNEKIGDKWFVTWGVIPRNDRMLVLMEELKGLSRPVMTKLTDMRSSGVAEIAKIERRKTHARTRLIVLSNPRKGNVDEFGYGVESLVELIPNMEDIRRFDACMIVGRKEVDQDLHYLSSQMVVDDPSYSSEICRSLVLWAWTRTADQCRLDDNIWKFICEVAGRLCADFSENIPIIDKGSAKFKVARLAIALACRTFSTEDYENVIVRKCHVLFVESFLRKVYSTTAFGYDRYTAAVKARETLKDPQALMKEINVLGHRDEFIESALAASYVDEQDLCDWCEFDRALARGFMSKLVRCNALVRDGRSYRKTAQFVELLKTLQEMEFARPAHVESEGEY